MAYDQKTAERVRSILSERRDVIEKPLMGGLCFMVDGAMCCSLSGRGGLLVRVGPQAYPRLVGEPYVTPMKMGRRTMTGFVRVSPEGYRTKASLKKWIGRGLAFLDTRASMPERVTAKKSKTRPGV